MSRFVAKSVVAKTFFAAAAITLGSGAAMAGANCQGGSCYRLVVTPPAYSEVAEQVLVRPAQRLARYIPAEYGSVSETVTVRPAQTFSRHIPAVYGTTAETVMVAPARKVWQISIDAHGQKVGCWVTVPAQYATRHRQVVIREAQVVHETIPAVHAERHRRVLVRPATVAHDVIAAAYETRHRQVMVHPGSKAWAPVRSY
jgi:hypothetical protein